VNKKKMKIKTKSKSKPRSRRGGGTRKIFKKSHKRYVMKGMKRRIQRGGNKDIQFKLLMESYNDSENDKTKYAMTTLFGYWANVDYTNFKKILEERNKILPELRAIATGRIVELNTEVAFDNTNWSKLKFRQGQWTELVKHMHSHILATVSAENARAAELTRHLVKADNTALPAHKQLTPALEDVAAGFQVDEVIYDAKHPLGPIERKPVDLGPTYKSQAFKGLMAPISESTTLDTSQFVEPLKTYLTYRLSAGREGSSNYTDRRGAIQTFNEKIISINSTLSSPPLTNSGQELYTLLTQKELIPVYFKDGGSRDDSVPDYKCVTSVSGNQFKKGIISSGKHHCRTCGRCMNEDDKRTYGVRANNLLNPVCIDCYNLFSGTTIAEPGGAAASFSSTSLASLSSAAN
jgi:hypothetical protein